VSWHWVRGHGGQAENERAHNLAQRGIEEQERSPEGNAGGAT
jgi:ribonuclease HI